MRLQIGRRDGTVNTEPTPVIRSTFTFLIKKKRRLLRNCTQLVPYQDLQVRSVRRRFPPPCYASCSVDERCSF